jgi:predicted nucleic acid-binding protein
VVLIDTNVAIALWVESDWTDAARRLLAQDPDWRTEAIALIEFANVMATYVRRGLAPKAQALQRLDEAKRLLGSGLVLAGHRPSLSAAVMYGVSVYDARFLVAADQLGVRLVTEDRKLRRAAPDVTRSLEQAIAA